MALFSWKVSKNKKGDKSPRKSKGVSKQPEDRIKMEMKSLNSAAEDALDPSNSNRADLIDIYTKAWKDPQVISEREKAESFVISEPFELLDKAGNPDEEKVKLFQRPWYESFVKFALYVEFWGHSLLEFQEQDSSGEFTDVIIFPRKNVRPFEKLIVVNPTDKEGESYQDALLDFFLIEIGTADDLGKLEAISREVIWKTFSRSDWSEYNERYGKPMLDFGIDTDDDEEIKKKQEMAENFGSNLYMIRDVNEQINIHQFAAVSAGQNFENSARFCDEQIAKLMNGQIGTSDEKSFVGSAEVHERILKAFNKARLRRIQNTVNYKLVPFLCYHGYQLEGYQISYPYLKESKESEEPASNSGFNQKKKPDWVLNMQD